MEPSPYSDSYIHQVYSNTSSFVQFDKFGQGVIATFSKGPVSSVLQGGHIASNSNVLSKVKPLSCFDDISGSTEIVQYEKGLETTKTIGVETRYDLLQCSAFRRRTNIFLTFFRGGGPDPICWHKSFSQGQIRLHPEFHCPRSCGSAWWVVGWVVGWETPIIIITLHLVELS